VVRACLREVFLFIYFFDGFKDILFLALLTLNVLECKPGKFDIEWYEIFLWIWVFAMMIEEGVQYSQDRGTNKKKEMK
jgi:hypothetical protein